MDERLGKTAKKNDQQDRLQSDAMTQEDFLRQDAGGRNLLHLAIEKENPGSLIELILQKTGAQQLLLQQEYAHGQTPLHFAANHRDINLIIIFFKCISVEHFNKAASIQDSFHMTTTHYLIRNQHPYFMDLYHHRLSVKQQLFIAVYFKRLFKYESLVDCLNGIETITHKANEIVGRLQIAVEQRDPDYFYAIMAHVMQFNSFARTNLFAEINKHHYEKTSLLIALTDALSFETQVWSDALLMLFSNKVIPNIIYPGTQEALLTVIQRRVKYSNYELMIFSLKNEIDFYRTPLSRENDAYWKMRYQMDFGRAEVNTNNSERFYRQSYQDAHNYLSSLEVKRKALHAAEHGLYVVVARLFSCENEDLYNNDAELNEEALYTALVIALKKQHNEVARLFILRLTPSALSRCFSNALASDEPKRILEATQNTEIIHFVDKRIMQYETFFKYFALYDKLHELIRKNFSAHTAVLNVLLSLECATFAACVSAMNVKPLSRFFLYAIALVDSIDFILFLNLRLRLFASNAKKIAVEVPEVAIALRIVEICFAERAKIFNMSLLAPHHREQLSIILRDGLPNDDFEKHMNIKIISLFAGIGAHADKVLQAASDLMDSLPFLFADFAQTSAELSHRDEETCKVFVKQFENLNHDLSQLDAIPQDLWDSLTPLYTHLEKNYQRIPPEEMRAYIRIMKRYFAYREWTDLLVAIKFKLIDTIKLILAEPLLLNPDELNQAFQFTLSTHNFVAMHLLLMQSAYCCGLLLRSTLSSVKPFLYTEIRSAMTFSEIQLLFDVYCSTYKNVIFPTNAFSFFAIPPAIWVDVLSRLKKRSLAIANTMQSIDDSQHDKFKKIIKFERSYCENNEKIELEYLNIYRQKKLSLVSSVSEAKVASNILTVT